MSAGQINEKREETAKNQSPASLALGDDSQHRKKNNRVDSMDPLIKTREAYVKGIIPEKTYALIQKRFPIIISGINRIEKASGIGFPIAYVDPAITVTSSDPNAYQYGILFARTIPLIHENNLQVVIQISAPLVAYGLRGTIHAILAHEFLHYLELIRKISKMEVLSDEISGNMFENVYADETRLFEPRAVFDDRTLLLHITRKFPSGFRDYKLEDKVIKNWIDAKLPVNNISLDTNTIKISAESMSKIKLDAGFVEKINELELKSAKISRKQLY